MERQDTAILDTLDLSIAVVDEQGVIVTVNRAWRRFADENGLMSPDAAVGVNYLAVCEAAVGRASEEAATAAKGIRAVLRGGTRRWSVEYPCHSLIEERWFLMTVTSVNGVRHGGAVITHLNITAQKRARDQLIESERRFRDMLGNVELIAVMLDHNANITYCNDYFLRSTGWNRDEVLGRNWFEVFIPPERSDVKAVFMALIENQPASWHHTNDILTRSGERRLIRWNNSVLRTPSGGITGIASIGDDITQSQEAERKINRLNRVYAVLSSITSLTIRERNRDELYREACRIAVNAGFPLAWIGICDQDTIIPVANEGSGDDYGDLIPLQIGQIDSMPSRAVRERRVVLMNDLRQLSDQALREAAHIRGFKAAIVLPLMVADRAIGVLALYGAEYNYFNEDEIRLLRELASNIAFAIDHIDQQERLNYLAYYDPLTGLANRHLFFERVAQYARSSVGGDKKIGVYVLDIEHFKEINDSLGRSSGDALLKQLADWLSRKAGDPHLLARLGADRFAGVLPEITQHDRLLHLVESLMEDLLAHPFRLDDAVFRIAAKVGIALLPEDGSDAEAVFRNAEAALKKAKSSGSRFLFYSAVMTEAVAGRLTLENELRQALELGQFVLYYQPKVSLATGKITGAEALIRWNRPSEGLVPPSRFIPILEEAGLISEVGQWAIRKALRDGTEWRLRGLKPGRIAVNVSPLQLRNRRFIERLVADIGPHDSAAGLELEITESLIMEDVRHSIASLQAIRELGVHVAIDDFGTGFSSLSQLSKLPADALKIDRSFVVEMTTGPQGLALISTIISLAHSLQLKVVAEGVETPEQSRLLRLLNCDEAQGFLYGSALPFDEFESVHLNAKR